MAKADNQKISYMLIVLSIGTMLLFVKFYAWYLTGSVAIFSDALESIVNVLSGAIALFSLYYAAKPKDMDHPYGHGKIEFVAAGLEGGMVLFAGILMLFKGIAFLLKPHELLQIDMGIYLVFIAGLVNGIMGYFLVIKGKKLNSPALYADGKHLLTDTITSGGLLIALALVYFTGNIIYDGIVSIIMGIWILFVGYGIIKHAISSLLDKADFKMIDEILMVLNSNRKAEWIDIHNLRVQRYGSSYHVDCHLTLPWYLSLKDAHVLIEDLRNSIASRFDDKVELFVHSDPCLPFSCEICEVRDCQFRTNSFKKKVLWTAVNIQKDKKHAL